MKLILIRHGQTANNISKRYTGVTDVPLTSEAEREAEELAPFRADRVFSSPLMRAVRTAEILFPENEIEISEGLHEMDFGKFEGKTAEEMADDPDFKAWIKGGCIGKCPGGESAEGMRDRVAGTLEKIVTPLFGTSCRTAAVVCHGAAIMGMMSAFADPDRYIWEWLVGNYGGYEIDPEYTNSRIIFKKYRKFEKMGGLDYLR
ncbi:MAG: histidine phosphatase family protein [Oscillospiraceae bacterium]|jgi:alpha-ribazole phosphatase